MSIDVHVYLLFTTFLAVVTGLIAFQLGKRKTDNHKIAGLTAFLLSIFIPLGGVFYVVILTLKNDIDVV